jgi:hypothetical protein
MTTLFETLGSGEPAGDGQAANAGRLTVTTVSGDIGVEQE